MLDEEVGADKLSGEHEANKMIETTNTVKITFAFVILLQVLLGTIIIQPSDILYFSHSSIPRRACFIPACRKPSEEINRII